MSHEFGDDLDFDGNPQLLHMNAVSAAGSNDDERLVGMLHDKETPYMDYVRNICESGNKVAPAFKINDLNHNLKRGRDDGNKRQKN